MSRDWTPEELAQVSAQMKAAGHMSFEEFCVELNELNAKAVLERYAMTQAEIPAACPRCGEHAMSDTITHNALSRRAHIYICDACGMAEAIEEMKGQRLPLSKWSLIRTVDALL